MLNSNKKTVMITISMLGATAVLAGGAWLLFTVVSEESTSVKAAETAIAILEAKTRDLAEAKEGLAANANAIEGINRSFISEDHFVDFVQLVEALGRSSGVALKVQNAELPEQGGTVRVTLEAAGTYEQIAHFVMLLDHSPYPSIIARLSMNPDNAERGDRIRASLRFDVFNYRAQ